MVPALHGFGCRKDATPDVEPPGAAAAPASPASTPPVDHLMPGELVEGKAKAFALVLPRDVTIDNSLRDEVLAHGDATPEAVANYVRARVREGTITVGAMGTTFEHVRVPAEPTRELRIKVSAGRGYRSAIDIRDITPPVVRAAAQRLNFCFSTNHATGTSKRLAMAPMVATAARNTSNTK